VHHPSFYPLLYTLREAALPETPLVTQDQGLYPALDLLQVSLMGFLRVLCLGMLTLRVQ